MKEYEHVNSSLASACLVWVCNKRNKRRQREPGMLRAITRLLFGGEQETPDDFKSGEMQEEEWQVVSHQGQQQKMLLCIGV